jgi:hypothetical protein
MSDEKNYDDEFESIPEEEAVVPESKPEQAPETVILPAVKDVDDALEETLLDADDPFEAVPTPPEPPITPGPIDRDMSDGNAQPAPPPPDFAKPVSDLVDALPENNQLALTSIISAGAAWGIAIVSACISFFVPFAILCGGPLFLIGNLTAIITGHLGLNQIQNSNGTEGGENLAKAGLGLGYAGAILSFCLVCVALIAGIAFIATGANMNQLMP